MDYTQFLSLMESVFSGGSGTLLIGALGVLVLVALHMVQIRVSERRPARNKPELQLRRRGAVSPYRKSARRAGGAGLSAAPHGKRRGVPWI